MTVEITDDIHRLLGIELFNYTWELLDKTNRTPQEADTMIHAAHASRFHWEKVGRPVNLTRGDWQISRVYAVLQRPEPALYHARRCLEVCQANGIGDFDLAYAYEAMARASSVAGDTESLERYKALAYQAGEQIAEEDDKKLFLSDMDTLP